MGWLIIGVIMLVLCVAFGAYSLVTGFVRVPDGHLGVVYQRFGRHDPSVRFTVRPGGGTGYQAATLPANRYFVRPQWLYRVTFVPRTSVPVGTIAVVIARDGGLPPHDRTLGRPVRCDHFQDGRAFLLGGGEMGRQLEILPGGATYDINPHLFEVITVDNVASTGGDLTAAHLREITVPEGTTGVVIVREGRPPDDEETGPGLAAVAPVVPGHRSFQYPEVFLDGGGQRGAQAETLPHGGVYRINPWFARIILIPTRDLILDWTKGEKPADNYDVALEQIRINVEGHWLHFDMSQTIRIPARTAPGLVGRFGEQEGDGLVRHRVSDRAPVQRFVEKVLGGAVGTYFQSTASGYKVLDFIDDPAEIRKQVETQLREVLARWGVVAVTTTLGEFEPEGTLDEFRRLIQQKRDERVLLGHEHELLRLQIENARLITAREVILLEPDLARAKIELQAKIDLLGENKAAVDLFLQRLSEMKVPNVLITGGGAEEMLQHLPLADALRVINETLGVSGLAAPLKATADPVDDGFAAP